MIIGRLKEIPENWHHWFAWRPVFLMDGRIAWLSVVERKRIASQWIYDIKGFSDETW